MREIKFRAWDEQAKIMHHNFQCIKSGDLNKGGSDWIIPLEPITNPDWVVRLTEHVGSSPHFRNQFKVMQYSGLKDNSDPPKEIYEGDIVRVDEFWPRDDGKFDDVLFFCGWRQDMCCFWFQGIAPFPDMGLTVESEHEALIIGNIYENPELLK